MQRPSHIHAIFIRPGLHAMTVPKFLQIISPSLRTWSFFIFVTSLYSLFRIQRCRIHLVLPYRSNGDGLICKAPRDLNVMK